VAAGANQIRTGALPAAGPLDEGMAARHQRHPPWPEQMDPACGTAW